MDRNFDELCDRLKKMIYGSPKGRLRIELLMEDLEPYVTNKEKKMYILDAGGGFGPISLKLAELGHKVLLCDISEKMLEEATSQFHAAGLSDQLETINLPFQELPEKYYAQFDLVMSHAVLEWLEKPKDSFRMLKKFAMHNELLSLMFYNLNSLICQNAIKGNFIKLMNDEFSGNPNGLTPMNPLTSDGVMKWCDDEELDVVVKTGIRVFYDLMHKEKRKDRKYEDILQVEKKYCRVEPFVSMGRYVHFLGQYR